MDNKTALQKLKEKIETQKEFYGTRFPQFILWIDEFIEVEKQQIEDAFVAGDERGTKEIPFNAEQYYSQTFKKQIIMSEKKTIPTQFGQSATCDFEYLTWTFQMPKKYRVVSGEFAIVDKILYDQLIQSIEDLSIHCQELEMQSIFLSNVAVTVKKLQGVLS